MYMIHPSLFYLALIIQFSSYIHNAFFFLIVLALLDERSISMWVVTAGSR